MAMPKGFYVYAHFTPTWSSPFYIGKGKSYRAWCSDKRGTEWKKIASEGLEIEIVQDGMSEPCAYTLEKIIIDFWGTDWLVNKAKGGGAPYGVSQSIESRIKRRMAMIGKKNHNYGRPLPDHVRAAALAFNLGNIQSPETRKKRSLKMSGKNHPQLDQCERSFTHNDGMTFIGLRIDFIEKYGLSPSKVSNLISGIRKSHKGWKLT